MDNDYQDLVSNLSGHQNLLLTSLLSAEDRESWEQCKHLIVSHMPLLTLEMAVNRVCQRESHSIPTPAQIHAALEYAKAKREQFNHNPDIAKVAS